MSGSEEGDLWVLSGAGLTIQFGVTPTGKVAGDIVMTDVCMSIGLDIGMTVLVMKDGISFAKAMLHSIQRQDLRGLK